MDDIYVYSKEVNGEILYYLKYKDMVTRAYVGKNGFSKIPVEGSKTTPLGKFNLGVCFGKYDIKTLEKEYGIRNKYLNYFKIDNSHYWCCDINYPMYYNRIIDFKFAISNNISGEHLISYSDKQYEFAIEIKTNPCNSLGCTSAIFLHCFGDYDYTYGCVSVSKDALIYILNNIDNNTCIVIGGDVYE